MKSLTPDWFVEGTVDFEYKKYVLLAYLQHVSREFAEVRLYPAFSDLIFHYQNLRRFREDKQRLYGQFPARLSEEEFRKLRLVQQPELPDDDVLQEVDQIVEYAIPTVQQRLQEGKDIYERIDERIRIEPIGISPLYRQEGYVFFHVTTARTVRIYRYRIVFFENTEGNYHGITLRPVDSFEYSLANTYESMKLQLSRRYAELPNPAAYLVAASQAFPEDAALLPVAKRKLLAYLK
ncbi:MAG: hypothetical protein NW241_13250 [Bacteroidia bacterium]|nr:hypothetical protein [Bacteroidia bacterium]